MPTQDFSTTNTTDGTSLKDLLEDVIAALEAGALRTRVARARASLDNAAPSDNGPLFDAYAAATYDN